MDDPFGSAGTRWNVLRRSLLDEPDGLISGLEGVVRFGLALYSARSDDMGLPVGECPLITSVPPALNNHAGIARIYSPADPIDDTPTGDAIDAVLDSILGVPDPSPGPTIFIVATDGEPDRCEELDPQNGQAEAVAAVERGFGQRVQTYMISVGAGTVSAAHMQDMANAGLGRTAADSPAPYWVAGDDAGLRRALSDIVGGVLSCDVDLNGRIATDDACLGTVLLNGRDLPCDDANGWRAIGETQIRLEGDACAELTSGPGATLSARFPCDVVIF